MYKIPHVKIYCKKVNRKVSAKEYLKEYIALGNPETYYRSNDEIQCLEGKHRSLEDLFNLVRTEYKSISFEKFIKILYDIISDKRFVILFCPDIRKVVLYKGREYPESIFISMWWGTFGVNNYKYNILELIKYRITLNSIAEFGNSRGFGNITINNVYKILKTL